jgi:predicted ATPase
MARLPTVWGSSDLFAVIARRRRWCLAGFAAMPQSGPLIGRERELAELAAAIAASRLVTLTGPGGCGKTRVALELAERAGSGPEPLESVVVELAAIPTGQLVVDAMLRVVGGRERGGRSQMQVLLDSLGNRDVLLMLDNCEHVATEVRRVASVLLEAASRARVLVSSREPLGITGEVVVVLPPLSLPEPGGDVASVVRSDAGRFFVDRAAAADPTFALTPSAARSAVRICLALDGLPLALSLAAARVGSISMSEIADGLSRRGRLVSAPGESALPQHRSMRASLDWSQQLLNCRERALLRCLSVFAGGWTAAAARAVALPEATEAEVLRLLDGL